MHLFVNKPSASTSQNASVHLPKGDFVQHNSNTRNHHRNNAFHINNAKKAKHALVACSIVAPSLSIAVKLQTFNFDSIR